MQPWIMIVLLLLSFCFGYFIVCRISRLLDRHGPAFPHWGSRRIHRPRPKNIWDIEYACIPCYDECRKCKEPESHERCDP